MEFLKLRVQFDLAIFFCWKNNNIIKVYTINEKISCLLVKNYWKCKNEKYLAYIPQVGTCCFNALKKHNAVQIMITNQSQACFPYNFRGLYFWEIWTRKFQRIILGLLHTFPFAVYWFFYLEVYAILPKWSWITPKFRENIRLYIF